MHANADIVEDGEFFDSGQIIPAKRGDTSHEKELDDISEHGDGYQNLKSRVTSG